MPDEKVAKVTIRLPRKVLEIADRLASEKSTTRSAVITELLKREEEARVQALMAEGYREMAEENLRLAEEMFPVSSEMVRDSSGWPEPGDG